MKYRLVEFSDGDYAIWEITDTYTKVRCIKTNYLQAKHYFSWLPWKDHQWDFNDYFNNPRAKKMTKEEMFLKCL